MRRLIFYFLVLLAAVWIGLKIAADPGYLLIAYQKVTVEMPLWLAVLGLLGCFLVLYILLRVISNIRSLSAKFRAWSRQRRVRRAWQRTHRGLIALSAGEWRLAEKDLLRAAPSTDTPIINYLASARAAQAQGDLTRRDSYLAKVETKSKLTELALGLTQAELQIKQHQYEQALAILHRLQQLVPKHKRVLMLLKQIYLHLHDWSSLEILLPSLEKYQVITAKKAEALAIDIYEGLLKSAAFKKDDAVTLVWQRVPKNLRTVPRLLRYYTEYLLKTSPDEAETVLRQVLQKQLDNDLLQQYGRLDCTAVDKQLQHAEIWLKQASKNAMLLLTLGRLCIKNELWGKARAYLEASIGVERSPDAYYVLGQLLERLGEEDKALVYYREGLALKEKK